MFCRFCGNEIKGFRFLTGIMVFACDSCKVGFVIGFRWEKIKCVN